MTETTEQEQIVMTTKHKTTNSTTLIIERRKIKITNDKMHIAGGEHTGIIINKEIATENGVSPPAELSLQFQVFLVSAQTGKHTQESRTLRFWFKPSDDETDAVDNKQAAVAQDFFRELVAPQDFPRDYVGFIKKVLKLMQHNYKLINKLEIELNQLEDATVPTRPLSVEESTIGVVVPLTKEKLLELIESAYPNPLTIQDVAKDHGWAEEEITLHLNELQSSNLVKPIEHGAFTRQQSHDAQITIVKQMPKVESSKQPTIAIITAQYCEKLAVDAMIENKETFVRYTTVGESNVYTLGNIGSHRIVCTKLPSVGHTREAMTAAGNTTTRLLGTFQRVDYVFLVGVGGGVPHYTDYNKHVRLGDVVISYPTNNNNIYFYCDKVTNNNDAFNFEIKSYGPKNMNLQEIAQTLKLSSNNDTDELPPWVNFIRDGLNVLSFQPEPDFRPPSLDTDKLYMNIGNRDIIEVAHPIPKEKAIKRKEGCPRIHLSAIASGRQVVKEDRVRQKFAAQMGVLSFDCEFDAVIESILGNCKDSFICIRGISDYKDGTRQKEWQPYASLVAASVMKSIICNMEPTAA